LKLYYLLTTMLLLGASCSTTVADREATTSTDQVDNPTSIMVNGSWLGKLNLPDGKYIPFNFSVDGSLITIENSSEKIEASLDHEDDSIHFKMPAFDSEFKFVLTDNTHAIGYWINNAKKNYRIPFEAEVVTDPGQRFNHAVNNSSANFEGKWETAFEMMSEPYKAIGLFKQNDNLVTGTFLTETGDYRFLQGNVINDSLFLSCFDGAHAFLFTAVKEGDSLKGTFYSGKHYKDELWVAVQNDTFELSDPDSLTYLVSPEEPFSFSFPGIETNTVDYPSEKYHEKVVIVQIFGSWCPNCKDESVFYNDLYREFHQDGLEIIGLGFEIPETLDGKKARVKDFMESLNIPYDFAIGGAAGKTEANEALPQLNHIMSFPTSIFIDRSGKVRKIHTGFYGPGTGAYYDNYKEQISHFVKGLLMEDAAL